jgi:crotonobetainyl-CoA:carnitine CoA-transferase CaiB-like acyl-CoA transferase
VLTLPEALADPQAVARRVVAHVNDPVAGVIPTLQSPFRDAARPPGPSPMLGEHTRSALEGVLQLTREQVDALVRDGVVRARDTDRAQAATPQAGKVGQPR